MNTRLVAGYVLPISFSEKKKQIVVGESKKNKSGKKYKLVCNIDLTEDVYQSFYSQIPYGRGSLLIIGQFADGRTKILEVISSNDNLRNEFKKAKNTGFSENPISRKSWLLQKIKDLKIKHIFCQLASLTAESEMISDPAA